MRRFNAWLDSIAGAAPDPYEPMLHRMELLASLALVPVGIVWGTVYLVFAGPQVAMISYTWALLSLLAVALFGLTKHHMLFARLQLALVLLMPLALHVALGGFVNSSGILLASFIAPLGAIVIEGPRRALGWLAAYGAVLAVGAALDGALQGPPLPDEVIVALFLANIGSVTFEIFLQLAYFIGQRNRAFRLLAEEEARSERLLLNVLPQQTAELLKANPGTIADTYASVSILFADIVDFTPLSSQMPATEMVELLNEVYSHFDGLAERYGVEKIRTIGDNYMAACGVPVEREDHAQALAAMALDMRDYALSDHNPAGDRLKLRLGISSGPVVAGVIGRKKFVYDVWGDAVNTASRMESHGVPGEIQISPATFELVKDDFECRPRGSIRVKGKGSMETWFLVGRKTPAGRSAVAVGVPTSG